jgi:hypothetical protein
MMRLSRLAALAALAFGCTCAKKEAEGPVARPARVHSWASLGNLDQTFSDVATLAGRFGFASLTQASLREALTRESGLGPAVLAEIDLHRPIRAAGVKGEGPAASYASVYALPLRDERKFLAALRKEMDVTPQGKLLRLAPKSGGGGPSAPLFASVGGGHALVCPEPQALEVARDWVLRSLCKTPAPDDLSITLTSDFLTNLQQPILDLAERIGPALTGLIQRMAARTASLSETTLRADLSPTDVVLGLHLVAKEGGAMHEMVKRQVPGPAYAAGLMPAGAWLFYADHHSAAALAEVALDVKSALLALRVAKGEEIEKAVAALAGTLGGEVAVAASGTVILAAAQVRDAAAARAALDTLVAAIVGTDHVRRDGPMAVVELPLPGGLVPQIIAGRPAVASHVDGQRLLVAVGAGAEDRVRELAGGAGGGLDKSPAFAKAAAPVAGAERVGLVYVSVAQLLRSIAAAVPGAATQPPSDAPGVLLDWAVNHERTAMDVALRVPADALTMLGPLLQSLPFVGGGRSPMPGAPWKPGP